MEGRFQIYLHNGTTAFGTNLVGKIAGVERNSQQNTLFCRLIDPEESVTMSNENILLRDKIDSKPLNIYLQSESEVYPHAKKCKSVSSEFFVKTDPGD